MAITGKQMITFEWTMIALTLIFVVIRLYVQIRRPIYRTTPPFQVRFFLEFLVVFAWFHFLISGITDSFVLKFGGFDAGTGNLAPTQELNIQQLEIKTLKVYYLQNILYLNGPYAIKSHFLLFYRTSLISPSMRKTRFALNLATAAVVLAWTSEILLCVFACQPISRNWSTDDDAYCTPFGIPAVYYSMYIPHLATDLMVYFLPIPVLLKLRGNIAWRQRAYACLSFGFGFLCVGFAATQIACNLSPNVDISTDYVAVVMELTWMLLVVSVPAFKLFLRDRTAREPETVVSKAVGTTFVQMSSDHSQPSNLEKVGSRDGKVPVYVDTSAQTA